jgi:indole-3-glycerol phosphate synthase
MSPSSPTPDRPEKMPNEYTRTHTEPQASPRTSLSSILAATRRSVEGLRARRRQIEAAVAAASPVPPWCSTFAGSDVVVIAELKRRSPSAGEIVRDLNPERHARAYARGGAGAISVLTEGPHFGGSLDDLAAVRRVVELPILRKDFIVDPLQVLESRAAGASAVLLIARGLSPEELRALASLARDLGLGTLVEVHRREELDRALAAEPDSVGVNSRDLETFQVDLHAVEALLREIPSGMIAIAESGLRVRADVERVAAWGADGVLVGTALAGSEDPESAVRGLVGSKRQPRPRGRPG